MASCLTKSVSDAQLKELKKKAIDWALATGISMRPTTLDTDQDKVVHAPFALFPTPIPSYIIQQATQSMVHFNTLMHKAATDYEFLQKSLENVVENDEFTRKLWEIYMAVKNDKNTQPLCLGLFRNDFMLDVDTDSNINQIKQIEFNSIAASFSGLSTKQVDLHRYVLDLVGQNYTNKEIPDNQPDAGLAAGMVKAWQLYGEKRAVILFLVSKNEKNFMDQKLLEYAIYRQNKDIKVIHKTFEDLIRGSSLTEDRKFILNKEEVAVVYYRVGYTPQDYTSNQIWSCRLKLEQSKCIKCPPIHYQLVGAKKIQQVLAVPEVLEKFVPNEKIRNQIRCTFAGQYTLDMGAEGDRNLEMGIKSPEKFVLKPQREGGGNNMYDNEIKEFLEKHRTSPERSGYILMEKIQPKPQINYLIKAGVPFVKSSCISELGIYGCYIGNETEEIYNTVCGHILRTKTADTNEGGVCAGFSGIDSPYII